MVEEKTLVGVKLMECVEQLHKEQHKNLRKLLQGDPEQSDIKVLIRAVEEDAHLNSLWRDRLNEKLDRIELLLQYLCEEKELEDVKG